MIRRLLTAVILLVVLRSASAQSVTREIDALKKYTYLVKLYPTPDLSDKEYKARGNVASGFFVRYKNRLFFITNYHVVTGARGWNLNFPKPFEYTYDSIQVRYYNKQGKPHTFTIETKIINEQREDLNFLDNPDVYVIEVKNVPKDAVINSIEKYLFKASKNADSKIAFSYQYALTPSNDLSKQANEIMSNSIIERDKHLKSSAVILDTNTKWTLSNYLPANGSTEIFSIGAVTDKNVYPYSVAGMGNPLTNSIRVGTGNVMSDTSMKWALSNYLAANGSTEIFSIGAVTDKNVYPYSIAGICDQLTNGIRVGTGNVISDTSMKWALGNYLPANGLTDMFSISATDKNVYSYSIAGIGEQLTNGIRVGTGNVISDTSTRWTLGNYLPANGSTEIFSIGVTDKNVYPYSITGMGEQLTNHLGVGTGNVISDTSMRWTLGNYLPANGSTEIFSIGVTDKNVYPYSVASMGEQLTNRLGVGTGNVISDTSIKWALGNYIPASGSTNIFSINATDKNVYPYSVAGIGEQLTNRLGVGTGNVISDTSIKWALGNYIPASGSTKIFSISAADENVYPYSIAGIGEQLTNRLGRGVGGLIRDSNLFIDGNSPKYDVFLRGNVSQNQVQSPYLFNQSVSVSLFENDKYYFEQDLFVMNNVNFEAFSPFNYKGELVSSSNLFNGEFDFLNLAISPATYQGASGSPIFFDCIVNKSGEQWLEFAGIQSGIGINKTINYSVSFVVKPEQIIKKIEEKIKDIESGKSQPTVKFRN